jgi:hypothetical protein
LITSRHPFLLEQQLLSWQIINQVVGGKVMPTLKVAMSTNNRRFELEGAEETVLSQLGKLQEWLGESVQNGDALPEGESVRGEQSPTIDRATLRSFLSAKRPANSCETMAVLFSYKKKYEGKDELLQDEVRASMIQAGARPPGVMGQALTDCRRRYGYIEPGSKKGYWRLSHQGETLVEIDLPRTRG